MKSVHNFIVTPKGQRYNNAKKVGDSELILNTEIFNHQYVNREAVVISTPIAGHTDIKDQIFLYKRNENWMVPEGYCFVKPLKATNKFNIEAEKPLQGIVKYSDGTVNVNSLVGFTPNSEYEFIVDGERLYRVLSKFITIKYEYQGDEKEYNPSWAKSS
jgi:hypothetical protein